MRELRAPSRDGRLSRDASRATCRPSRSRVAWTRRPWPHSWRASRVRLHDPRPTASCIPSSRRSAPGLKTFLRMTPVDGRLIDPTPEEFAADFETLVRVTELPFHHPGYYTHFRAYESAAPDGRRRRAEGRGIRQRRSEELARHIPLVILDFGRAEGAASALREARHLVRDRGWPFLVGYPLLSVVPGGGPDPALGALFRGHHAPRAWKARFGPVPRHQRWRGGLHDQLWRRRCRPCRHPRSSGSTGWRRTSAWRSVIRSWTRVSCEWVLGLAPRFRVRNGLLKWVLRIERRRGPRARRNSTESEGRSVSPSPSGPGRRAHCDSFMREVLRDAARREYADGDLHLRRFDAYLSRPTWMHEARPLEDREPRGMAEARPGAGTASPRGGSRPDL